MNLSDNQLEEIRKAAKRIGGYGTLEIHFNESSNFVDIVISDRVRISKEVAPKAGEPARVRRVVVMRQD
jgi:hypothetical protein